MVYTSAHTHSWIAGLVGAELELVGTWDSGLSGMEHDRAGACVAGRRISLARGLMGSLRADLELASAQAAPLCGRRSSCSPSAGRERGVLDEDETEDSRRQSLDLSGETHPGY